MLKSAAAGALTFALGLVAYPAFAKVSAEEAARLSAELTPVGAERAASQDGSIPAWTPAQQRGPITGVYPADAAIDAEKPLFTITLGNAAQYTDKLSAGHRELLRRFPTYKMNVYPAHRQVAFLDFVYAATIANATSCELIGTDNPQNCKVGFTFPIPKSGAEVIWNHKVKWRGDGVARYNNQLIVQPSGEYQLTKLLEEANFYYATRINPVPLTRDTALFLKYLSETMQPPRVAGTILLVHERAGSGNEGRQAWLYSPGLKRIRRAPSACCDNPVEGTDGHQFFDQIDMFNGILDRYNWKIVGKREIYIPYNSNLIGSPKVKYASLARPKHLNQDLPRYELHRVWVVDAELRPGTSHTLKKRRFYVDEDSWQIVLVDGYDNRDQLYQFQEGHLVFFQNILGTVTVPEVIYHLDSGRYFVTALANEDKPNDYSKRFDENHFEASTVQKRSTR